MAGVRARGREREESQSINDVRNSGDPAPTLGPISGSSSRTEAAAAAAATSGRGRRAGRGTRRRAAVLYGPVRVLAPGQRRRRR